MNIVALSGIAMLIPALHAGWIGDFQTGRLMLYLSFITLVGCAIVGLALANRSEALKARGQLITVVVGICVLPLLLAVPFPILLPGTGWTEAYFEMVSSLTTTGATVFAVQDNVPMSLHLWRGVVAWLGGYVTLIIAFAIMAPLNIGGFEITRAVQGEAQRADGFGSADSTEERLYRIVGIVSPPYVIVTAALIGGLLFAGLDGFSALMTAMAVVSTSGVLPDGATISGQGGLLAEALIAIALLFCVTALAFDPTRRRNLERVQADPEVRLLVTFLVLIPLALALRHFLSALDSGAEMLFADVFRALWAAFFTTLSVIGTLGRESAYWQGSLDWAGVEAPALLMLGLLAIGGGVASTAGGVKLMRFYALYKHGVREMERLTLPSSIGGSGTVQRRIRREGAFIAWIYVMLFLFSLAVAMVALSLTGIDLISGLKLALVMLSNAGPALPLVSQEDIALSALPDPALLVLCATMIVGRLEVLVLFALADPAFWRR
ncbi:MAG: potassium transporter TrkG [Pseudomonadota bacterium]